MSPINVSDTVAEKVRLLAAAWETTEDQVVFRLLEEFLERRSPATDRGGLLAAERVLVYAMYDGNRIEGEFEPQTGRVIITSGPLAGRAFRSPSGAAIATVQKLNPAVQPNRNGWMFWIVAETGETLASLRRR